MTTTGVTDANSKTKIYNPFTSSNLSFLCASNTNQTATFKLRINGIDGNQTVKVPLGTTGTFEDSGNFDRVRYGDQLNFHLTTDGGVAMQAQISKFVVSMGGYVQGDFSSVLP